MNRKHVVLNQTEQFQFGYFCWMFCCSQEVKLNIVYRQGMPSSVSVVKNEGRAVQGQPVLQARPWQCERSLN